MKRFLLLLVSFTACLTVLYAQQSVYGIKGNIVDKLSKEPVEMVAIVIPEYGIWATSNEKGDFILKRVPKGEVEIKIECLGFKTIVKKINVPYSGALNFVLEEDNLTLETVTVTAKENKSSATTTRVVEKQAIEHLQVVNATDIMSLLPGGQTVRTNLAADPSNSSKSTFKLRGDATGFGTAVVMDGVRLSSNSDMGVNTSGAAEGVDSRNINASNIESIEVITGVPSVEYGDMTSGMVILNTKKGRTPLVITSSLNPRAKSFSVSKGVELSKDRGIINVNAEYTHAFSNPTSRYTTYYRNNYGLNYSKVFNREGRPVNFNVNLSGGIAKQDVKEDPDAYKGEWKGYDYDNMRGSVSAKWLVNGKWLTNLNFEASGAYSDNTSRINSYHSGSTITGAINTERNGYYETNYLPAQYYILKTTDSKGLDFSASLKATLNKKLGVVNNNIKLGAQWNMSGNVGEGVTYAEGRMPSGFRNQPYSDIPFMHNFAAYLEDNVTIPIGKTQLSLVGGIRMESIYLNGMEYDTPISLSPRFNGKYTLINNDDNKIVKNLAVRGAWGKVEKLPSLAFLYPLDQYNDKMVYSKNYGVNNQYFCVAKTYVYKNDYNASLKWAQNRNIEVGIDADIAGVQVSAVYFNNRTIDPYTMDTYYVPYAYNKSDERFAVPNNPEFFVDNVTGDIYVTDKDNPSAKRQLIPKSVRDTTFVGRTLPSNSYSYTTQGVELSINFGQIKAIRTSFIVDATYTFSNKLDGEIMPYYPNYPHSSLPTSAGRSYEFVGYYVGDTAPLHSGTYNGVKEDGVRANLTAVTHIPEIRLTVSAKLEAQFYERTRHITYYNGKEWAYLIDGNGNKVDGSVYHQREYATGVWPVAYCSFDGEVKPFTAKEAADPRFARLINTSNSKVGYVDDGHSPFFIANISVTKEIGKIASISFYVNNFTNASPLVRSWATGISYVNPRFTNFTYGATLRLKF